jgi:hypothetical protein
MMTPEMALARSGSGRKSDAKANSPTSMSATGAGFASAGLSMLPPGSTAALL